MRPTLTDRRLRVERRLFDTNEQIMRAREELGVIEAQLVSLGEDEDEARVRMLVAETAMADRQWREAKGHAEIMEKRKRALLGLIAELERAQDDLIAKLVI